MKNKTLELLVDQIKRGKRYLIDGENRILGRVLSRINGLKKPVLLVNVEKMIITGAPRYSVEKYRKRLNAGSKHKGPFISSSPQRLVKRIYRGMCNYRSNKAFYSFYCFTGTQMLDLAALRPYDKLSRRTVLGPHMSVGALCNALSSVRVTR